MTTEYWYLQLPTGKALRGERTSETINRELQELVARGWVPVTVTEGAFLLKKESTS